MKVSSPQFVSVRGVSKSFTIGDTKIDALKDVDLTIAEGDFVCLIGASGCGKSTLLRIIAGFEQASVGEVRVGGRLVTDPGPERGMVFQDYALFPWLTVRQNIGFGPKHRGLPAAEVRDKTETFLDMVGLRKFADAYPHQLSGGMKQRVSIARVLANDARLVLMDEPFGALDAMTREKLQDELLEIWARTGLTVIFVTHSIEEAVLLANRIVVMSAGPGRITSVDRVDLVRPRDLTAPDFNDIRRSIGDKLHSHVARAKAA